MSAVSTEVTRRKIRLLRGQVVVRLLDEVVSKTLFVPKLDPRSRHVKTHRGVVLGKGPPALWNAKWPRSITPHEFEIGDVVGFHFRHNLEAHTAPWGDFDAIWIPQDCVDYVLTQ